MTTSAILEEISRLPWQDQLRVAEETLQALQQEAPATSLKRAAKMLQAVLQPRRHEQPASLEQAAEALAPYYRTDLELTAFTSLDAADFYEAR